MHEIPVSALFAKMPTTYIRNNPIYNSNSVMCVCVSLCMCVSDTLGTRQRKIQKIVK